MYAQFAKDASYVQKYGGTSVGSPERIDAVAERIARFHRNGYQKLAIVVSAMSGETNRLVDLIHKVNPKAREKIYDLAVAAGEQVSVALLAAALERHGIPAEPLLAFNLGIFTDNFHAKARIHSIDTQRVNQSWKNGSVPIIAGFQGITDKMDLTTLGRGGSDTSAVAIAVALQAAFCEINTDVDGVYSTDPRIVSDAKLIRQMDYEVALEMAALGSKVLHSRCVELGAKYSMPIIVRNSFKADESERTIIMDSLQTKDKLEAPTVSGITLDKNVVKISISGLSNSTQTIHTIFEHIAAENINVDIIVHSPLSDDKLMRLGFTIGKEDLAKTLACLQKLKEEKNYRDLSVETKAGLAKISAVGVGMRSYPGVASKIFGALNKESVDIQMISTSEIKVSCVIPEDDGQKACQTLHQTFFSPSSH